MRAIDATLATAAGLAPSLLDRPEVAALVDALDVDAVVRQVWIPFGTHTASVAPPGARSIAFADARRGGDEWLLVAVAFELPAGVGTAQDRPAALLRAMLTGFMRVEVPWAVR